MTPIFDVMSNSVLKRSRRLMLQAMYINMGFVVVINGIVMVMTIIPVIISNNKLPITSQATHIQKFSNNLFSLNKTQK